MSIKYRVILLLGLLAAIYVLLTTVILQNGSLPTFSAIEKEFAEQNAKRVSQYLNSEFERLDNFSVDWGQWTESRDYMLGSNPNFIDDNLTVDAPSLINVDILMFVENDYTLKWGGVFQFESLELLKLGDFLSLPLSVHPELYQFKETTGSTLGFVNGPGPTLMIASRPIVDNDTIGPITGTLVLGRVLDERFIADLNENLALESDLIEFDNTSEDFVNSYLSNFEEGSTAAFLEFDSKTQLMNIHDDIYGQPAIVSVVESDRTITEIGRSSLNNGIAVLIVALFFFILAIWYLLEKLVLRPVDQLKEHMHKIAVDEDLSQSFALSRKDEFGEMAREFNSLMAKLKSSQEESEDARKEAVAASKSKSQFLATMSHEIRTPMNGVLGMADLLLISTPLTSEQKQFGLLIKKSGSALLKILNDILDFSKIEAGKFVLEETEFSMREALEDVAELFAFQIQNKGLEFIVEMPTAFSSKFSGDEGRIRQIVSNLLNNAVKFTDDGYIRLKAIETVVGRSYSLKIEVEDTGIGIEKKSQQQLFNSFTQEDASITRRYGGTGLGLAVTKQLAELMDGQAGLSSEVGVGSKFWVSIPLRPSGGAIASTLEQYNDYAAIVLSQQANSVHALERHLEYWGVTVRVASEVESLPAALEEVNQGKDFIKMVVFIDEAVASREIFELINRHKPSLKIPEIKLVIMNTVSNRFPESTLRDYGVDLLLNKPIKIDSLAESFLNLEGKREEAKGESLKAGLNTEKVLALKGLRVLLVEDNGVNILVAQNMLKKIGCRVLTANNGQEALLLSEQHRFDVILMDCAMPVMDGLEATRKIREFELHSEHDAVNIIALTANAMDEYRDKCLKAGMNDFLSKPLILDSLIEKLFCVVS